MSWIVSSDPHRWSQLMELKIVRIGYLDQVGFQQMVILAGENVRNPSEKIKYVLYHPCQEI